MSLESRELLRQVKHLKITASKNAAVIRSGNYRSNIRGSGMLFKEARKYVPGESIRLIDWNITARMNQAYVKEVEEERQVNVMILFDISSSMHTGWQRKTKIEYAAEVAATIAAAAVNNRDHAGIIFFSDHVVEIIPERGGESALFSIADALVRHSGRPRIKAEATDIRAGVAGMQMRRKERYVVFIISDFIDADLPEDLKRIRRRHEVNLIHIHDPLEYTYLPAIRVHARAPEGVRSRSLVSPGSRGSLTGFLQPIREICLKQKFSLLSLSTRDDVGRELARFMAMKKRRQR